MIYFVYICNMKYKIGDKYYNWTVVDIVKPIKGRTVATIVCKCGTKKVVELSKVSSSKQCVKCCKLNRSNVKKSQAYIGETNGYWTIVDIFLKDNKTKIKCKCKCGTEKEIIYGNFKLSKMCAFCSKKAYYNTHISHSRVGIGDLSGEYFSALKQNAKRRNIKFNVSKEYCWNLYLNQKRKCALSGKDILLVYNRYGDVEQTASLDRIDSTKGYEVGNLQWVNKWINKMKLHWTNEEFISLCKMVVENNK